MGRTQEEFVSKYGGYTEWDGAADEWGDKNKDNNEDQDRQPRDGGGDGKQEE